MCDMTTRLDDRIELRLPGEMLEHLRRLGIANERSTSAEARVAIAAHVRKHVPENSEDPAGNEVSTTLAVPGAEHGPS